MTTQTTYNIIALTIGFCSAVFFCIGNIINSPRKIKLQSTPFWDFSEPLAQALTAQRAQYIVGALLLVISFCLQILATQASPDSESILPQQLHIWLYLCLVVFFWVAPLSALFSYYIYRSTLKKVKEMQE